VCFACYYNLETRFKKNVFNYGFLKNKFLKVYYLIKIAVNKKQVHLKHDRHGSGWSQGRLMIRKELILSQDNLNHLYKIIQVGLSVFFFFFFTSDSRGEKMKIMQLVDV
jgi:hypothetical protein